MPHDYACEKGRTIVARDETKLRDALQYDQKGQYKLRIKAAQFVLSFFDHITNL